MEATVPGSLILREELTSPLLLAVFTVVVSSTIAGFVVTRIRPSLRRRYRRLAPALAAASIAAALATILLVARPGVSYGVEINGSRITVTYIQDDRLVLDACNLTRVELLPLGEAVALLKYRLYGLSDPSKSIHMGRFELRDGREAAVVIVGSHADKALILEDRGGRVAVVAVPGVERVYQAIQRLLEGCAGGSAHP